MAGLDLLFDLDNNTQLPSGKSCIKQTILVIAALVRPLMGDTPPTPASARCKLHQA